MLHYLLALSIAVLCIFGETALGAQRIIEQAKYSGTVEIAPGKSLFVEWQRAKPGAPILILLNGLTYETPSWDPFAEELIKHGISVLRYDPIGMGESLVLNGEPKGPISIVDQAKDLDLLTTRLGLHKDLLLLGLSYGGGLAIAFNELFSEKVAKNILVAPFTEPLEAQDQKIRRRIANTKLLFPWMQFDEEELYSEFLRQEVFYVYPYSEPSILRVPEKREAVFQLTEGIRKHDMFAAAQSFPPGSVSMVIAGFDQYIPSRVLYKFWNAIPEVARGELYVLRGSEHKVPEAKPAELADLTVHLLGTWGPQSNCEVLLDPKTIKKLRR